MYMFLCCINKKGGEAYIGHSAVVTVRILITPIIMVHLGICYGVQVDNELTESSLVIDQILLSLMGSYWLYSYITLYCTNSET